MIGTGGKNEDEDEASRPCAKKVEVICRSTAPVVRYVEEIRERSDHGHGTEVVWSQICEQCRHRA